MGKSIVSVFLACFLLTGSVLLPLGDFSLINDLPGMYKSYCNIKVGKPDVIDFVGDYLLGGRDLLGHNAHDAPAKADGATQFQHQANPAPFVALNTYRFTFLLAQPIIKHSVVNHFFHTSAYQKKLFRPPLA